MSQKKVSNLKTHKVRSESEKPTLKGIQIVQILTTDGRIHRYTGPVQIAPGETPQIQNLYVYEVTNPETFVAEVRDVMGNLLRTIRKDSLSDKQRIEVIQKTMKDLGIA